MPIVFIEDAPHTNGDCTQFTEILDWLVVMPWAIDVVVRVRDSSASARDVAVGYQSQYLMVLEKLAGVRLCHLSTAPLVRAVQALLR